MTEDDKYRNCMLTPSYRAWFRREDAIRVAKATAWAKIQSVYVELERAEQAARDAYDAEIREINREQFARMTAEREAA